MPFTPCESKFIISNNIKELAPITTGLNLRFHIADLIDANTARLLFSTRWKDLQPIFRNCHCALTYCCELDVGPLVKELEKQLTVDDEMVPHDSNDKVLTLLAADLVLCSFENVKLLDSELVGEVHPNVKKTAAKSSVLIHLKSDETMHKLGDLAKYGSDIANKPSDGDAIYKDLNILGVKIYARIPRVAPPAQMKSVPRYMGPRPGLFAPAKSKKSSSKGTVESPATDLASPFVAASSSVNIRHPPQKSNVWAAEEFVETGSDVRSNVEVPPPAPRTLSDVIALASDTDVPNQEVAQIQTYLAMRESVLIGENCDVKTKFLEFEDYEANQLMAMRLIQNNLKESKVFSDITKRLS